MLRGSRWFALAAVVGTAALVGPTVALADGCSNGSATSIYSECVPSASGSHHSAKKHSTTSSVTPPSTGSVAPPSVTPPVVNVPPKTKRALRHAGKDRKALTNLARNSNFVDPQRLKLASAPVGTAAFDLGTGPTLLVALLAGTVLVLLGAGGVRTWRNRHRV